MLKRLILKNRHIAVPVPISTMGEALVWIERSLLQGHAHLTSAILNESELINELYRKSVRDLKLDDSSRFVIEVEAPRDLFMQSLDVVCDLAKSIGNQARTLLRDHEVSRLEHAREEEVEAIFSDMNLLLELLNHTKGLGESTMHALEQLDHFLSEWTKQSQEMNRIFWSVGHEDFATFLSNGLIRSLSALIDECESLQVHLLVKDPGLLNAGLSSRRDHHLHEWSSP